MRVLLVSHEASRSGAPRVAVLVARSLVESGHLVQVVSRSNGPLIRDFMDVAPTSVESFPRVRGRLRRHPLSRGLGRIADLIVATATILTSRSDVVYVNSTAAATYLRPARWLRRRAVLHVHESATVARQFLSAAHAPPSLPGVGLIACSPSVQRELACLVQRQAADIPMLPSVPDGAEVERKAAEPPDHLYDPTELVVGCCGTVEARKGPDLWVAAARLVMAQRPERKLRFVWIGDVAERVETLPDEAIEFVGPTANPYAHMRRFDIGTLPSRDDPFPLVVLESMLLGTPMVAFGVGGVTQQIGDAGVIVNPGNIDGFAEAILGLVDDSGARDRLGAAAQRRVESLYSFSRFTDSLNEIVGGHPGPARVGTDGPGRSRRGRSGGLAEHRDPPDVDPR